MVQQIQPKPITVSPSDALVSVVIVVQNDQHIISDVVLETVELLKRDYSYYEVLIIDNGSTDSSVETIKRLQQEQPNIRLLVLSRRYDMEIAFAAALDNSLGDYVVLMDIRYDPPTVIPQLLEKARSGFDIVIAERNDRSDNTFFQKVFAKLFYRVYGNISGFYFAPNASYFRVLSRRAVNSIIQIKNKTRYLKYFNALVGFTQTHIKYNRIYRKPAAETHEGFLRSAYRAFDVMVSNTIIPLRFASLVGMLASFLNLLFLIYVFVVSLFKEEVTEGWISSSIMSATMFFVLFLLLTVISEYIARILIETKNQPLYFIADEYNSTYLTPNKERINVV